MLEKAHDLGVLLQSRTPLIVLETWQENEAIRLIQREMKPFGRSLYRWSITDGLVTLGRDSLLQVSGQTMAPEALLESIKSRHEGGIFALCDFHPYLADSPTIVRLIKDIALGADHSHKTLVFVSHSCSLPPEIRRFSAHAHLTLPTPQDIQQLIRVAAKRWSESNGGGRIKTDERALRLLTQQLGGLPSDDVRRLAYRAIADDGAITQEDIGPVQQAKFALLNQGSLLHYEYDVESMANVGGLENLKQWLSQRQSAFANNGLNACPDRPKGVLLLGVQGGGKSLAARAVAGLWQLPLLRFDMGGLYNKYIGETEKNLREVLAQAEVMAPCVLWMDELEKALSTARDDSGLAQRLLGYFLTWMAERKAPVFLVATSNDIQSLPAELVRKGRFDEIFFVDLPDESVRQQIFAIHLQKRGFDPKVFELEALAQLAEGFSGAEIEQAIVSAIYAEGSGSALVNLNTAKIMAAVASTQPLAVVMAEQINALRAWASERSVRA